MFRLLLTLFLMMATGQLANATFIAGAIVTGTMTLTKDKSPYIVTYHIEVQEGGVLIIEPGVEVRVDRNIEIRIKGGDLRAIGTAAEPITFVRNNLNDSIFPGINASAGYVDDSVVLKHCNISHAGLPLVASQYNVVMTDCEISFFNIGLLVSNSLQSCYLDNNKFKHGVYTAAVIRPVAKGAVIVNNEIAHCKNGIVFDTRGEISNNYLHDNERALEIQPAGHVQINNNKLVNNGRGLFLSCYAPASAEVKNNLVAYNGIGFYISSGQFASITNNTIKHNELGVQFQSAQNTITFKNNCIDSNADLNVHLKGLNNLDLSNNYWGTTDSAIIHSRITDLHDTAITGYAFVLPCLSQPDPSCKAYTGPTVTSVQDTKTAGVLTKVFPNPFSNSFTIELDRKATMLEIFSMTGQRITELDVTDRNAVEVDMSQHATGVYHYRVTLSDRTAVMGKLIKQ